jgi:diguanylate cyclase (GGDEF)-like protein
VFQKQLDLITQGRDNVPWVEGRFMRGESDQVEVEFSGIPFTYQGQWAVLLIFRDISERKLAQQRLEYLAHHDGLTGLPNRTLFFDRLNQTFHHARRYQQLFALLFIDLDRFKFVNDSLGHDVGDLLLQETAERLKELVRSCDTIARMGGDEFTIILSRINEPDNARMVAEKIVAAIGRPFHLNGHVCSIGASIGISIFPDDGDSTEMLVKKADTAMYCAKKNGRGNAQFFNVAG